MTGPNTQPDPTNREMNDNLSEPTVRKIGTTAMDTPVPPKQVLDTANSHYTDLASGFKQYPFGD